MGVRLMREITVVLFSSTLHSAVGLRFSVQTFNFMSFHSQSSQSKGAIAKVPLQKNYEIAIYAYGR